MKQTRTFDGAPVYERPAIGDEVELTCSCGRCFTSKVKSIFADPTGGADGVFAGECPDCGSTAGFQCEPATSKEAA